jgi:hypothetical protein
MSTSFGNPQLEDYGFQGGNGGGEITAFRETHSPAT